MEKRALRVAIDVVLSSIALSSFINEHRGTTSRTDTHTHKTSYATWKFYSISKANPILENVLFHMFMLSLFAVVASREENSV